MSLYVVATPIGNKKDISARALETLKRADVIIGEEERELNRFLTSQSLNPQKIELLNEHTKPHELKILIDLCKTQEVCLVSDCGTPGFQDPGADLVKGCHKNKIKVTSLPGASSLMCLLSLSGERLDRFHFFGFLPQKTEERDKAWDWISKQSFPLIVMDTPYRFNKTLEEAKKFCPDMALVIGCDFTTHEEEVFLGIARDIISKIPKAKREFLIILIPPN